MTNKEEGAEDTVPKKARKVAPAVPKEPVYDATLRIPTTDPYSYIELVKVKGTREEIYATHQDFLTLVRGGNGLEPKEFNAVLDEYLTTGTISGDPGVLSAMNIDQSSIIQSIKRSRARTNK